MMLFKRDKLLSMRNNSLGQVLDQILVDETKDVVDRLNMFHVVDLRFALRFSLKSNLDQGLRSYRFYLIELLSFSKM